MEHQRATGLAAKRPKRGEVRQALLDAGLEALKTLTPASLVTGLGVRDLARRAGVSPAGFYHHFPTVDDYARALVEHVYSPSRVRITEIVNQRVDEVEAAELPLDQGYRMHENEISRLTNDPEFRVRLGLWALGGAEVDEAFRDFLAAIDDGIVPAFEQLIDAWGRELRPPFTNEVAVALHVALVQGASIRHLIDPERMPIEVFKRMASALTFAELRLVGDKHTLDDRLAEINYYPLKHARAAGRSRATATRAKILDAAARLFGQYGYDEVSVAQIARRAGIAADTVYAHFGSKSQIAVSLFLAQAEDFVAAHPVDESEPLDELRMYLELVATFAVTRPDTAPRYLDALLSGETAGSDAIADRVLSLVSALRDEGTLRDDVDAVDVATSLVWGVCRQISLRPSDGPQAAVDRAWKMLVDGAQARASE